MIGAWLRGAFRSKLDDSLACELYRRTGGPEKIIFLFSPVLLLNSPALELPVLLLKAPGNSASRGAREDK
jgi:hypothetical protein